MGSVGDSYDTAQAESVWSSFKREAIDHEHFATKAEARRAIFSWIVWYNSTRLHTSIGKRPPIEYEQHLAERLLAA
jgi:transposase InsO family protein